jgi:septal ring factor EnvC (AmiA/AmiB activator)
MNRQQGDPKSSVQVDNGSKKQQLLERKSKHLEDENAFLKRQITSLEDKLSEMSQSLANLTKELSLLRNKQNAPAVDPVFSFEKRFQSEHSSFMQAIESAIIRILPGIIHSHVQNLSPSTS